MVIIDPPAKDGYYASGATVRLTAIPQPGYVFNGWSGHATGKENPLEVIVEGDRLITATFLASDARCYLGLETTPMHGGEVFVSPEAENYPINSVVTLQASANPGFRFSHWGGIPGVQDTTATLRLDSSKNITAVFDVYYPLELTVEPAGRGTVSISQLPGQAGYAQGTVLTLTAEPAHGYKFERWGGSVSGSENPLTIMVSSQQTITAHFVDRGPFAWYYIAAAVLGAMILLPLVAAIVRRVFVRPRTPTRRPWYPRGSYAR